MRTEGEFGSPARWAGVALALLAVIACSEDPRPDAKTTAPVPSPSVSDASATDWPRHGRDDGEQRFSPLAAIDRSSVADLGLAWSYATGTNRGLEATPIVVDGVMVATASWSKVFALDAANGKELWRFDPEVPGWKARHACCDVVNRGVAVSKGRVFVGTIDGRLLALDLRDGSLLWEVRTTPIDEPYTITGAPRVVKGRVIIGNGGADLGVRGFVSAYDEATGDLAWRFYTVPGSKRGPHEHAELETAAETWPEDSLFEAGLGGTAWDSLAFDPELDLLYVGTGNSAVYDRERRSPGGGDNLYLASILALRPDTGELVWHYQTTPGEQWDYTATQHMILADLEIEGRVRQVLMQAPKNGFFYVLDRATGELLSAEPYVHVSWATGIDMATGRPRERPEASWSDSPANVAPSVVGGHNWHPMSFHPGTGLVYIPAIENAYTFVPKPDFVYRPGLWNTGEDMAELAEMIEGYEDARFATCGGIRLVAWDPVAARKAWEVRHPGGLSAGLLSTAGGLVFQGSGAGTFSAFDAANGDRLWSIELGIDAMAAPVSYEVDGVQYVAVLAGVGGSQGGHATRITHTNPGHVYAFRLGGKAPRPKIPPRPAAAPGREPLAVDAATIERGRARYAEICMVCHGIVADSSGLVPDLRVASAEIHEQWDDIVLGGTRQAQGMASFADVLSRDDARAIQAYVLERAWHEPDPSERFVSWFAENACLPVEWFTD